MPWIARRGTHHPANAHQAGSQDNDGVRFFSIFSETARRVARSSRGACKGNRRRRWRVPSHRRICHWHRGSGKVAQERNTEPEVTEISSPEPLCGSVVNSQFPLVHRRRRLRGPAGLSLLQGALPRPLQSSASAKRWMRGLWSALRVTFADRVIFSAEIHVPVFLGGCVESVLASFESMNLPDRTMALQTGIRGDAARAERFSSERALHDTTPIFSSSSSFSARECSAPGHAAAGNNSLFTTARVACMASSTRAFFSFTSFRCSADLMTAARTSLANRS